MTRCASMTRSTMKFGQEEYYSDPDKMDKLMAASG